ncbi:MAG TPA: hypothetical protein VK139_05725 [Microbacteriaceae bacterium]|nr:hypothetical protein [Microbacteriaceae bacterium]
MKTFTRIGTLTALVTSLVGLSIVGAGAASAEPAPNLSATTEIYAFGYSSDQAYVVDTQTGVGTPLPNQIGMGPGSSILGASINPVDGKLYFINSQPQNCQIWELDTQTGIGTDTEVVPNGTFPDSSSVVRDCTSMVFAPDGTLYMGIRSQPAANTYLVRVNFETGAMEEFWAMPNNAVMNFMVVSPQDGNFYMQTSHQLDDMYTWDPATGTFTDIAAGGNQTMYGAAFLPDGTIYANSWSGFVSVDFESLGSWTQIGNISNDDIGALVNGTNYWALPEAEPASTPSASAAALASTGAQGPAWGALSAGFALLGATVVLIGQRRRVAARAER